MAKSTSGTARSTTTTKKAASLRVEEPVITATTPAKPAASAGKTAAPRPAVAKPAPTHDAIAKRAYEVWIRKGRPVGRDLENWQDAERELRAGK